MNLETTYTYLAQQKGAAEEFPFGPQALVFKVMGKMFALLAPDSLPPTVALKCDPEQALLLRERYEAVQPGYHMNKKHWNTVTLDGSIPGDEIRAMIDASYALVVQGLKKADREHLETL
jgi:predicted DNA-binding protein (MmcQ/YjbR family)